MSTDHYLVVAGAQRLINFLSAVFDARVTRRYDNPDGSMVTPASEPSAAS
jgi:uncharacterized glyoxalase superfamily protein PhnB